MLRKTWRYHAGSGSTPYASMRPQRNAAENLHVRREARVATYRFNEAAA